jgi:hypothetical protein
MKLARENTSKLSCPTVSDEEKMLDIMLTLGTNYIAFSRMNDE